MKKLLFIAASAIFFISCNKNQPEGYHIKGTIDLAEASEVFIEIPGENGLTKIDTAVVTNGNFEFKGKTEEIGIAYLQAQGVNGRVPFVLENQTMNAVIYKDSVSASKVTDSYNNNEFVNFNKSFREVRTKVHRKTQEFEGRNKEAIMAARESNDVEAINKLSKEHRAINDEIIVYMQDYVSNNPKSYVSLLLLSEMISNPEMDFQKLKSGFEALNKDLKSTKLGKEIEEKLKSVSSTAIGQKAPDFSAPNPQGKMVSLKESMGKVTLIDFWASWCGPCRRENPNVVALYNEFHEKGLNIIGVSLDKEDAHNKWVEAIATDNLTWTQISNLKFWQDPIAQLYNVKSIPATFLLDESGKIVAKNLRGEELRAKVAELLR